METRTERNYRVCAKVFAEENWEAKTYIRLADAIERARRLKANGFMVKIMQIDVVISTNEYECLSDAEFNDDAQGKESDVKRYLEMNA